MGASEKRAAAAEAESALLRKAKEASEARVAETLKAYEAMREVRAASSARAPACTHLLAAPWLSLFECRRAVGRDVR